MRIPVSHQFVWQVVWMFDIPGLNFLLPRKVNGCLSYGKNWVAYGSLTHYMS